MNELRLPLEELEPSEEELEPQLELIDNGIRVVYPKFTKNLSFPQEEYVEEEEKYPQEEQKKEEIEEVKKKDLVTAKDVKAEIQARIDKLKNIKTEYSESLKRMIIEGKITIKQGEISFKNFEKDYNNNEQKRINRLEKGLNDEENINRIVQSSNLKLKQQFKRKGKEYEQELINTVREEAKRRNERYLVTDPNNPDKKILDPKYELPDEYLENKHFQELNKNEPDFIKIYFKTKEELESYINQYDKGIDFIKKDDRYLIDTFIDNIFKIKNEPIPIIYDILNQTRNSVITARQNMQYIINNYLDNLEDDTEKNNKLQIINSYILKKLINKYYIINENQNLLLYTSYIDSLVSEIYNDRLEKGSAGYEKDMESIPNITLIKYRFDKLDTKHITIQDKLDIAKLWNRLYTNNKSFSKLWTHVGLDQDNYYGRFRGTEIWDKIFDSNPFFSKTHNLFAIEGLEALKERQDRKKNYDTLQNTFIKKNKDFFEEKGETLTVKEAKIMFDRIIKSLEQGEEASQREQQSESSKARYKKGSGISKRKILKHLKSKSTISKPTTKGLDTAILKILNS